MTNPSWVQTGELGIAFVALLILSSVIVFVMRTGNTREEKLLRVIERVTPALDRVADEVAELKKAQSEINGAVLKSFEDRIGALEHAVRNKPDAKRKTSRV